MAGEALLDSRTFRDVLGRFPTGVAIVTGLDAGEPVGMVVGSFTSVSLDPPLVAFLPAKSSTTYPKIRRGGSFCVNILAADQGDVCRDFFAKRPEKFADAGWSPGAATGSPVLDGVVAWIDCEIEAVHEAGDHDIVIGRVLDLSAGSAELPLLFFEGGYGRFNSLAAGAWAESETLRQMRNVELARPELEATAADLGLECLAIAREGEEMVLVASSGTMAEHHVPTRVGLRYPIVPPMGALFYAFGGDEAEDEWIRLSCHGSERHEELRQAIDRVRQRGWSIGMASEAHREFDRIVSATPVGEDRAEVRELGRHVDIADSEPGSLHETAGHEIRSVSAPVFGPDGVAFIFLAFGFRTVTAAELGRIKDRVVGAASRVSRAITAISEENSR